ncbi:hypothetical protein ACFL0E_00685, partial [Nanoarchaeota archaeon]
APTCYLDLTGIKEGLRTAFDKFKYQVKSCVPGGYGFCTGLAPLAGKIKTANGALKVDNCIMLY